MQKKAIMHTLTCQSVTKINLGLHTPQQWVLLSSREKCLAFCYPLCLAWTLKPSHRLSLLFGRSSKRQKGENAPSIIYCTAPVSRNMSDMPVPNYPWEMNFSQQTQALQILKQQSSAVYVQCWVAGSDSMTRLESRFLVTRTRLTLRKMVTQQEWLNSSHSQWLETRVRVILPNLWVPDGQTQFVCTQKISIFCYSDDKDGPKLYVFSV